MYFPKRQGARRARFGLISPAELESHLERAVERRLLGAGRSACHAGRSRRRADETIPMRSRWTRSFELREHLQFELHRRWDYIFSPKKKKMQKNKKSGTKSRLCLARCHIKTLVTIDDALHAELRGFWFRPATAAPTRWASMRDPVRRRPHAPTINRKSSHEVEPARSAKRRPALRTWSASGSCRGRRILKPLMPARTKSRPIKRDDVGPKCYAAS